MASPEWTGTTNTTWTTATNWFTGSAPVDADTPIFNQRGTRDVDGIDQATIELASLDITSYYTYNFGNNGTPVKIDSTLVEIGKTGSSGTPGSGSGRINLWTPDLGSTFIIYGTKATSTDTGKEPVRIKSKVGVTNKLIFQGTGMVGIATDLIGDTAEFAEIYNAGTGTINVASGTTLTKWRQEAGTGNLYGALTTLQNDGGKVNTYGSGAITTANISGTAVLGSSGTITTLNLLSGGNTDMTEDSRPKTVTTVNMYKGSTFKYDPSYITLTNPINLIGCDIQDVKIICPKGLTVAVVKT